jgi:hypothetical protein
MKKLKHKSKTNSVVLCCNNVRCPEVYHKSNDTIQIRDDDGFVITITKEQARLIPEAIDIIEREVSGD